MDNSYGFHVRFVICSLIRWINWGTIINIITILFVFGYYEE